MCDLSDRTSEELSSDTGQRRNTYDFHFCRRPLVFCGVCPNLLHIPQLCTMYSLKGMEINIISNRSILPPKSSHTYSQKSLSLWNERLLEILQRPSESLLLFVYLFVCCCCCCCCCFVLFCFCFCFCFLGGEGLTHS